MNLQKIKNDIPKAVKEWAEQNAPTSTRAFVSVILYRYGEIVERTFATRKLAKKGVMITEVRRRATGNHTPCIRNIYFTQMGGYTPVFECQDKYSSSYGYRNVYFSKDEFNIWYDLEYTNYFTFESIVLNADILTNIAEFKYCGYSGGDIIKYINEYRNNPMVEYFGKLNLPVSKSLIAKLEKDKHFKTFVFKNIDDVRKYGPQATLYAYNHNSSISEAHKLACEKRVAVSCIPSLKGQKNLDYLRIIDYCDKNNISYSLYNDYLRSIITLKYDLKDTKNIYPRDFHAMHDLRTMEYKSHMDKLDREKRKALYKAFAIAGTKATAYEYSHNGLLLVAPRDISDLVAEGEALHHCVGKMGYDKKMANNEIVIMFVREESNPTMPYVTIEFDLKALRLRQSYGKSNSIPPTEVITFVNEWVALMQNKLRKEAA
jgi:hypothetical protein